MKPSLLERFSRYLAAQAGLPEKVRQPRPLSVTASREASPLCQERKQGLLESILQRHHRLQRSLQTLVTGPISPIGPIGLMGLMVRGQFRL